MFRASVLPNSGCKKTALLSNAKVAGVVKNYGDPYAYISWIQKLTKKPKPRQKPMQPPHVV